MFSELVILIIVKNCVLQIFDAQKCQKLNVRIHRVVCSVCFAIADYTAILYSAWVFLQKFVCAPPLRPTLLRRGPCGSRLAEPADLRACGSTGGGTASGRGSGSRWRRSSGRRRGLGRRRGFGCRRNDRWCRHISATDMAPAVAIHAVWTQRVIPDDVCQGRRGEHGFQQICVAHVCTLEARATQVRIEEVCTDE